MKRLGPFAGGMVCVVALGAPVWAADVDPSVDSTCAVSGFNGKFEGAGGYYKDRGVGSEGQAYGALSLALPLGCLFGAQLDAGFGTLGGKEAGGVGLHVFTRDSESYLLGGFASYSAIDNFTFTNDIYRAGVEGELYFGQFTFEGLVGYEDADLGSDDWFSQIKAAFYVTDDFRISAGYRHYLSIDAATAGLEWQPNQVGIPMTLFVEGQVGNKSYTSVSAGFRIHFGAPNKSLKQRHREDDPSNSIMNLLSTVCTGMFPSSNFASDSIVADDGVTQDGIFSSYVDSCGRPVGRRLPR